MENSIFEKLGFNDLDFGDIQSVDEMTIIPIIGNDRTTQIAKPYNIQFEGTSDYGSMIFSNKDEKQALIPSNIFVMTDQEAQDHAMSGPIILESKTKKVFNNACCIQSYQGGLITGNEHHFDILPLELRLPFLASNFRHRNQYDKLWKNIIDFTYWFPSVDKNIAHLDKFFRPYTEQLNCFVAEFEPVKNQIGAIILFSNSVVGIEILPTNEYWNYFWEMIVRGCYGAQLLKLKLTDSIKRSRLVIKDIPDTIDEMIVKINNSIRYVRDLCLNKVNEISIKSVFIDYKFCDSYLNQIITTNCGGGDLIIQNNNPIYLSMVERSWK